MAKANVDPAPMICRCGGDAFHDLTRIDRHNGGTMAWKGTAYSRVVQCGGCDQIYAFTAPHPHNEQVWVPIQISTAVGA